MDTLRVERRVDHRWHLKAYENIKSQKCQNLNQNIEFLVLFIEQVKEPKYFYNV